MLQGLHLYELVFIIIGGVFFLVLIFLLIWNVIKGKKILVLLPFFLLPIAMIGWPTINSISYDKGKIEIKKTATELAQNPADTTIKKKLEQSIARFDTSRAADDPAALNNISQAYYALGKYDSASMYNNRALIIKPDFQEAQQLKTAITKQVEVKNNFKKSIQLLDNNLKTLDAKTNNTSQAATNKIVDILKATETPVYTDEKSNLVIAKGLATVNKNQKSLEVVNQVLKSNPQSQEAVQLKKEIEAGKYNTAVTDSVQTRGLDTKKFNGVIMKAPSIKH